MTFVTPVSSQARTNKIDFCQRLKDLFEKYAKVILVTKDNVTATQLLHIRHDLNGIAELVFGKNSLMRRVVGEMKEKRPQLTLLTEHLFNGVGLLFTNGSISTIKKIIDSHSRYGPAKVGTIAPNDVIVPKGPTPLPSMEVNMCLQLNLSVKIERGTISVFQDKLFIQKGDIIQASEANFLQMLNLRPFRYTLEFHKVFDNGQIYDSEILDIGDNCPLLKIQQGIHRLISLSLSIGYPSKLSLPFLFDLGFKDVASISVTIDHRIKPIEALQEIISDPEAFKRLLAAETKRQTNPQGFSDGDNLEPHDSDFPIYIDIENLFW